ncbi:MAG: aminodeoxychorismate lyase [Gammaproteobacteria bacterium]|nr:aminodeoxychorismate lyase [Gammaproteobacteria bacterium]
MITTIVNGIATDQISVKDRALNYGDGVFETIAVQTNKLYYWAEHYRRLKAGCERLGIAAPAEATLLTDITKLSFTEASSVVKIIVSRGQGGRGYASDPQNQPTVIISNNLWPDYVESYQQQGITVRLCQHRLLINPALAGIKHLNRLDQVLARSEWQNNMIQEGLMLDQNDNIVEGISSNVFMKINKQWLTAPDSHCAVAGVMREAVLRRAAKAGLQITQRHVHQSELPLIEQMFVCNSIWGIVPVRACESYEFKSADDIKRLQTELEQDTKSAPYVI